MGTHLAGPLGVEPRLAESESAVLPVERQPNSFYGNQSRAFARPCCRSAFRSFPCCRITCLIANRVLVNKQKQFICSQGKFFSGGRQCSPSAVLAVQGKPCRLSHSGKDCLAVKGLASNSKGEDKEGAGRKNPKGHWALLFSFPVIMPLPILFNFGPRVAQAHAAIKDAQAFCAVLVHTEIAQALKLHLVPHRQGGQVWLKPGFANHK